MRWLNGTDSKLESNDSRFHGPRENEQKNEFPKKLVCTGGLMFFFRDLSLNLSPNSTKAWFQRPVHSALSHSNAISWGITESKRYFKGVNPNFKWGCIAISWFPTHYVQAQVPDECKLGHELSYEFWAWGDTEEETMANCNIIVTTMFDSLKRLSRAVSNNSKI